MVRECCWRTVEVEVASFVDEHAAQLTEDWHRQLVRHGHLPAREIMTGIGPVAVRCPRVRDRSVKAPTVSATLGLPRGRDFPFAQPSFAILTKNFPFRFHREFRTNHLVHWRFSAGKWSMIP
jgi:hypothetical protein